MAGEGVIKRRLKSLRQREVDRSQAKQRAAEALTERAARNNINIELQKLVDRPNRYAVDCRPVPMAVYYARDEEFESRRAAFYGMLAKVFSFEGWSLDLYSAEIFLAEDVAGREGRALRLSMIDQQQAVNINTNAAPLEYLISQRWLETKQDPPGYGLIRYAAALRYRSTVDGSRVSGLKAQDYDAGGSGFGPRTVSDVALDNMRMLETIAGKVSENARRMLDLVLVEDVWLWEIDAVRSAALLKKLGSPKARDRRKYDALKKALMKRRRHRIILDLHKAIDQLAIAFSYLTKAEYEARWVKPRRASPQRPR